MPKLAKELSATEVRRLGHGKVQSLKRARNKKVGDPCTAYHAVGGVPGLLLQVSPSLAKSWILRVTVGSKRRDIGLGGYPAVTLAQARDKARDARESIRRGIDPVSERRALRDALILSQAKEISFKQAAKLCHAAKAGEFTSDKHRKDWINSLERHAYPMIGSLLVADIDVANILRVLEPIWASKTETATRVRQRIESVLAWATVSGHRFGDNPARWDGNLKELLATPSKIRKVEHHPALPWQEVPSFMQGLRKREGMGARALEFMILTAARSGEARFAVWDELDFDAKVWTIPAERIKARKKHSVPLSSEVIQLLKALPRFSGSPYVFPAVRGGALSDMTICAVLRRMKIDAVPHGFRSSFKDWARSSTAYADEVSELALAHVNSDATRAAYARDELLPKRSSLMRDWAKYCVNPKAPGDVVSIGKARK